MELTYSLDSNKNTLVAKCTGKLDFGEVLSMLKIVYSKCTENKCQLVLMDFLEIENGNLPTHERFLLGEVIAKQWKWHLKGAFLYPEQWINKLAEIVANNRGANIIITHDSNLANKWLYNTE